VMVMGTLGTASRSAPGRWVWPATTVTVRDPSRRTRWPRRDGQIPRGCVRQPGNGPSQGTFHLRGITAEALDHDLERAHGSPGWLSASSSARASSPWKMADGRKASW